MVIESRNNIAPVVSGAISDAFGLPASLIMAAWIVSASLMLIALKLPPTRQLSRIGNG